MKFVELNMAGKESDLIGSHEEWRLYHRYTKTKNGWHSLYLARLQGLGMPRLKKGRYWLGWNGDRLARNRDAGLLEEHHPDIAEWVRETLGAEL